MSDLDDLPEVIGVIKSNFKLKTTPKDGVILQLHHTIKSEDGKFKRIRFTTATFNDRKEYLACSDTNGNIFILDFIRLKFWKLSNVGPCSALRFVPEKNGKLVTGLSKEPYDAVFIDIESGESFTKLSGHTAPTNNISFSSSSLSYFLTSSPNEAFIWEPTNYTKYFTLNTFKENHIQQIMFAPVCDNLVACFQNDTIQVWRSDTLKTLKQIIPSELKHVKSISFTMNGRAMVIAGLSSIIIIFSMDTWKAIKTVDLSVHEIRGVKYTQFLPQPFDGGSNKILAILTSDCVVHLYDIEAHNLFYTISPQGSAIRKVNISNNGKYFVCILQLGEVNVYNSALVMDLSLNGKGDTKYDIPKSNRNEKRPIKENKEMEQKMKSCLDIPKLRRILSEYGEYPEQYRAVIWRSILNIPRNKNAFISLVNRPIHPAYRNIEKLFTIHSNITLKNLKRLLSCLTYWSPVFGVVSYLPSFVFPFVKVLQRDPLLLFELVATVLINYCQLWFEYSPLPPINVLGMIENVLAEHDKSLLDHFCKHGVTSQIYALQIIETAFSEVLSCSEWLVLWDHILSNEPAFLLIAIVAYNITQRNSLKKLTTLDDIEDFYHQQNPIDRKGFLKKCYKIMETTVPDVHPRKFLKDFTPLEKGSSYPVFVGYPKTTVCLKLEKQIAEQKELDSKTSSGESLKEMTTKNQERQINKIITKKSILSKCTESDTSSFESEGEFLAAPLNSSESTSSKRKLKTRKKIDTKDYESSSSCN